MLNVYKKDFFKTEFGKKQAEKYFGHDFSEKPKNFFERIDENKKKIISTKSVPKNKIDFDLLFDDVKDDDIEEDNMNENFTNDKSKSKFHNLTLYDLITYYHAKGIVGEENLLCAMTLAAINKSSFGIEGYSGSGKTFIIDKLVNNLLSDVYKIQQTSNLAIFSDVNRINESQFIYIPELQKAMQNKKSPLIEVIKDLTEGKDANRVVSKKSGNGVDEFTIKKDITIIYTLALENDFKKDDESARRLIRFNTNNSKKHLDEIHNFKSRQRYSLFDNEHNIEDLEKKIKEHISACLNLDHVKVIDPFSDYITSILPKTQKSVGYIDHYYSLLDSSTKFNFNNRQKIEINGNKYILTNIEDHFNIFRIYFSDFLQGLQDFSNDDLDLKKIKYPSWKNCFYYGLHILNSSSALEKLRVDNCKIIKNWYSKQVSTDNVISVIDYISGNNIKIAKINEVQIYNER